MRVRNKQLVTQQQVMQHWMGMSKAIRCPNLESQPSTRLVSGPAKYVYILYIYNAYIYIYICIYYTYLYLYIIYIYIISTYIHTGKKLIFKKKCWAVWVKILLALCSRLKSCSSWMFIHSFLRSECPGSISRSPKNPLIIGLSSDVPWSGKTWSDWRYKMLLANCNWCM